MTNEQIEALIASGTREGNGVWIGLGNGSKMYVPDNVAPGESGLIYFYDSDPGMYSGGMKDVVTGADCNKITLMLGCGSINNDPKYLDMIDSVASYKGVGVHVNHSMGASAGAANGFHLKVASIEKNNEMNQTVVLLEPGRRDNVNLSISPSELATLKNSNSSMLFISEQFSDIDKTNNFENYQYVTDATAAGIPVIIAHHKDSKKKHMMVVDEFVRNSNVLDYLDGKAPLSGIDNFTFSYYDNGKWYHDKSFTEAVTLSGQSATEFAQNLGSDASNGLPNADFSSLNEFLATTATLANFKENVDKSSVTSSQDYVEYSVGEILNIIKRMDYIAKIANNSYQSTTSIPIEEDYVIHKYFNIVSENILKINKELQNCVDTAQSIDVLDKQLSNDVIGL